MDYNKMNEWTLKTMNSQATNKKQKIKFDVDVCW